MTTPPNKARIRQRIRRKIQKSRQGFFLRGLGVLLPAVLTIFIFTTVLQFVRGHVIGPINGVIYGFLEGNGLGWTVLESMDIDPYSRDFLDVDGLPPEIADKLPELGGVGEEGFRVAHFAWRTEHESFFRDFEALSIDTAKLRSAVSKRVHPAVGAALSIILVLTLGYLASGFLGRGFISSIDRGFHRVPLVRSVYPYAKKLVEFFLSDKELEFDSVVAAPYPSEGVWAIGFVTGGGLKTLHEELGGRYLSVFIPTSPMPMTGFTIFMDATRLIPLEISVDEALRVTVSAGVLLPPCEQIEDLEAAMGELGARSRSAEPDPRGDGQRVPEAA